jgi:hypothetical protein
LGANSGANFHAATSACIIAATMANASALRQRRCRARRRRGVAVLHVEANEFELVDALLAAGRLTEAEALRRPLVEKAAARLLEDFTARWLQKARDA